MAALTALSLAATVIAGGVAAYGQYQSGQAAKAIGERNNQLAETAAQQSAWEQQENARRERQNNESRVGSMRARLARNGVQINTGAPLEILGETAARLELNVLDSARQSESQRQKILEQGAMGIWEAGQQESAANINAFGTLLSTASTVGQRGYQSYRSGSLLS